MRRMAALLTLACLLLSGCSWLDGSYHSVTPHRQHTVESENTVEVAENYLQLRTALTDMISAGMESKVITVADFEEAQLLDSMDMAVRYAKNNHPIGAYAVEEITYEVGTVGGVTGVAVEIDYRHERGEIQKIQKVNSMEDAQKRIHAALRNFDTGLVLLVNTYQPQDIHQLVDDYAAAYPNEVMETPEVTEQIYPNSGRERVWVLKFTYQSSRESLRSMQEQVWRIFDSAALYVSQDAEDHQKLSQLYSFLMERFDSYQVKTSITPAYSLLTHGVGDSGAFAEVYARMCQRAGVSCQVVVGTRGGEPWSWNMVCENGYYYHVDLLECQNRGGYRILTDSQMGDYVWDYSAYPACTGMPAPPATEPQQETSQQSELQTEENSQIK